MVITRTTRNRLIGDEPVRGFESHRLRQRRSVILIQNYASFLLEPLVIWAFSKKKSVRVRHIPIKKGHFALFGVLEFTLKLFSKNLHRLRLFFDIKRCILF